MTTAMTAAIIAAVIGATMINRGLMRNRKKAGALIWRRSIQARMPGETASVFVEAVRFSCDEAPHNPSSR